MSGSITHYLFSFILLLQSAFCCQFSDFSCSIYFLLISNGVVINKCPSEFNVYEGNLFTSLLSSEVPYRPSSISTVSFCENKMRFFNSICSLYLNKCPVPFSLHTTGCCNSKNHKLQFTCHYSQFNGASEDLRHL